MSDNNNIARVWLQNDNDRFSKGYSYYNDMYAADLALARGERAMIDVYSNENMERNTCVRVSAKLVYRANDPSMDLANDMTSLAHLEEPNMLQCLESRYNQNNIYTSIAGVLVAINPYQNIDIYNMEWMSKYRRQKRLDLLPPHVFSIAESAYQNLTKFSENQSMICCGESGSGKTESTKMLMRYLANVTNIQGDAKDQRVYRTSIGDTPVSPTSANTRSSFGNMLAASKVEQQVLQANPVLEAFGNARTLMNDNSSRFAKFTKLYFNERGRIAGAHTETYLLEKSRVVTTSKGERNFHIFYQLCSNDDMRKKYNIMGADSYHFLNRGNTLTLKNVKDEDRLYETLEGLNTMNFNSEEQDEAFSLVVGVMNLGNCKFVIEDDMKTNGYNNTILSNDSLKWVKNCAQVIGVNENDLIKRLTMRSINIPGKKGQATETYEKPLNKMEAEVNRNTLAKALYNALFQWIVQKINNELYQKSNDENELKWIGVLDVFGFECFEYNSFEQLCINFANEKLQAFFNNHIIKSEQAEYRKEGIFWTPVSIADNSDVIKLISSKPQGILCLLDSTCIMPKGNSEIFHSNLFAVHRGNRRLQMGHAHDKKREKKRAQARLSIMGSTGLALNNKRNNNKRQPNRNTQKYCGFYIKHYAGRVLYDSEHFLAKNADSTHPDTITLFGSSTKILLKKLFAADIAYLKETPDASTRFHSVGSTFSQQLSMLMETLKKTTPYFIRCASPNSVQSANSFVWSYTKPQLRCGGLVEALRVLKYGYPSRVPYETIINKYAHALDPKPVNLNGRNFCEAILVAFGLGQSQYQLGLTKVFFRPGKQEFLESIFRRSEEPLTPEIETAIRKWLIKRRNQRAVATVRVFIRFRSSLKRLRAIHSFRSTIRRGVIYLKTLRSSLDRVRRLRGARNNAVNMIQNWWRHYSLRGKLMENIEKRLKSRRMNRFKGGGLDAKAAEELNMLRIQMKSAKRKQENERKKMEQLRLESEQKQMQAQKELEDRRRQLAEMEKQLEEAKLRENENAQTEEMLAKLKNETERLKQEKDNAARQARLIVQQREAEAKRREAELEKMRLEAEKRRAEMEKKAKELAKQQEEERKRKEEALQKLQAETTRLQQENERKVLAAKKLLEESEAEAKQKAEELNRLREDANKLKQSAEEEQMKVQAERLEKEAEQRRLQAKIEQFKSNLELQAKAAKEEFERRQRENQEKAQEIAQLNEERQRLLKEHEERQRILEEEREHERKEKEEALKYFEQESKRALEEQKELARLAQEQIRQKEEENKRKEEVLRKMQEDSRLQLEEQERKQKEAAELLAKQEAEANSLIQKLKEDAEAAALEFERKQKEQEEQARLEMEAKLKKKQEESESEVDRLKAEHAEIQHRLEMIIIDREELIEQLNEEANETSIKHEDELNNLENLLQSQKDTTLSRENDINKLKNEMSDMKDAHNELMSISQRLLDDAQKEIERLNNKYKEDMNALTKKYDNLHADHEKLRQDHQDLTSHFESKMKQSQEKAAKNARSATFSPNVVETKEDDFYTTGRTRKATNTRPDFTSLLEASILQQKGLADFIAQFKRMEGWMKKRRPGNKLLGKSAKTRYIVLDGEKVSWYKEKPTSRDTNSLGSLKLSDYLPISYEEKDLNNPEFELQILPRSKNMRDAMILKADLVEKNVYSVDMKKWIIELNTRIITAFYLHEMFRKQDNRSCRELVDFVCTKDSKQLRIENKVIELHHALTSLEIPLAHHSNFEKMALNNIALSDPSVHIIANILKKNSTIIELELNRNLITSVGAQYLADAFVDNNTLKVLKLNHNNLGDDGVSKLSKRLPKSLERLSLEDNNIGDNGAIALAEGLMKHGSKFKFPCLELTQNLIGNAGCAALARVCAQNSNIKSLQLSANLVSDDGVGELSEALSSPVCGLIDIELAMNQISSRGVIKLSKAMKATSRGLSLDLSGNKLITRSGIVSLVNADFAIEFEALKVVRGHGSKSIFVKRITIEEELKE